MKAKRRLFTFWALDHQAAQEHLNHMSETGWAFTGLSLGFLARYERAKPGEYRYFVDWCDLYNEDEGYLELCSDAGWEEICTKSYLRFFRSRPGETPSPIHTDSNLEYRRFYRKVMRRMAFGAASCILAAIYLIWVITTLRSVTNSVLFQFLRSGFLPTALLAIIPLLAVGGLIYCATMCYKLLRWRSAARSNTPFPPANPIAVKLRCVLSLLWTILTALMLLCGIADILLNSITGFLPVLIGGTIGLACSMLFRTKITKQTRRKGWIALGVIWGIVLICTALHYICPNLLDPLLPQGNEPPILTEYDFRSSRSTASPLIRYDYWTESSGGTQPDARLLCTRYITRSDYLADQALAQIRDQSWFASDIPSESFDGDGVWAISDVFGPGLLLRSENSVLVLILMGENTCDPMELADTAWAFLSEEAIS